MSRRRRFQLPERSTTFALNITSMTDMFTILLVFLLQTYSTAEIEVVPEKGQALPLSSVEANPIMSLQVSLTRSELKVQDRVVASLQNDEFVKTSVDPNDSNFLPDLFKELEKIAKEEKAREEQFNAGASTEKPNQAILDGKIMVKADQNLNYGVLRKVMYTASMAGFPKLKMATVVGN